MTTPPVEGTVRAPDFPPELEWLNTDSPLSLAALRGKIVLLDFWTYCCINCMHILPDLKRLERKYAEELVVIGVHSAKFQNERDSRNIREAILRYEIEHPVVNDSDFSIWRRYGARAWPTLVLIDPEGKVIGMISGEGFYEMFDRLIGEVATHHNRKGTLRRSPLNNTLERAKRPASLLAYPGKITGDATSNRLFFTDSNHNRVVETDLSGSVLRVFGSGEAGLVDGKPDTARFNRPQGVAHDRARNRLYVADTENHAVRAIELSGGQVSTLAGNGTQAAFRAAGGIGRDVQLNSPWDLALADDTLYVAMAGPHQLWKIDLKSGRVSVHAGSGREDIQDGPLLQADLAQPSGLARAGDKLYFADSETSSVRVADLQPSGQVRTLVGEGLFEFGDVDGPAQRARLQHPLGVAVADGLVYVADSYNHKIKAIDPEKRTVRTVAGTGDAGWRDGAGNEAMLNEPGGLWINGTTAYIADTNNHVLRLLNLTTGAVDTLGLSNLDRLRVDTGAATVITARSLEAIRFVPGESTLILRLEPPAGMKATPGAPARFRVVLGNPAVVSAPAEVVLQGERLILPLKLLTSGSAKLLIEGDFYFCEQAESARCYVEPLRLEVPLNVADPGAVGVPLPESAAPRAPVEVIVPVRSAAPSNKAA